MLKECKKIISTSTDPASAKEIPNMTGLKYHIVNRGGEIFLQIFDSITNKSQEILSNNLEIEIDFYVTKKANVKSIQRIRPFSEDKQPKEKEW